MTNQLTIKFSGFCNTYCRETDARITHVIPETHTVFAATEGTAQELANEARAWGIPRGMVRFAVG
jgi:hypothetical protein